MKLLAWPRGRYNHSRIVGVDVRVRVNFLRWRRPQVWWAFSHGFTCGPITVNLECEYEEDRW